LEAQRGLPTQGRERGAATPRLRGGATLNGRPPSTPRNRF